MGPETLSERPDGLSQWCYAVPHRIHTSKIYPIRSPKRKSTIIVYGHDNGIRVVWKADSDEARKGHSFASAANQTSKHMNSLGSIIHAEDIPLGGSEASKIAFADLPSRVDPAASSLPAVFFKKLVLAAVCSDFSIRVVTVSLDLDEGDTTKRNETQIVQLSSNNMYQCLPDSVALTFTYHSKPQKGPQNMIGTRPYTGEDNEQRDQPRHDDGSTRNAVQSDWNVLIASHSADLSGVLILHRMLVNKTGLVNSSESTTPWRTQLCVSPAVSLYFDPASISSLHHPKLLVMEKRGLLRILDCASLETSSGPSWLKTIHSSFEPQSGPLLPARTPILGACWAFEGRAVLVLLADSHWGLWHLEESGTKKNGDLRKERSARSTGNIPILGSFSSHGKAAAVGISGGSGVDVITKLAPMTPSTRKMKQETFFADQVSKSPGQVSRGGVCVVSASASSGNNRNDETALLWYGPQVVIISNLRTYCEGKSKGSGNMFPPGSRGEIKIINDIQADGGICKEISLSSAWSYNKSHPDILVTTDRQLTILSRPSMPPASQDFSTGFSRPIKSTRDKTQSPIGDLGVDGIDQMLDGLTTRNTPPNGTSSKDEPLLLL